MSKSLQYVKIVNALQAAGRSMTVAEVKAIEGIVPTRLSTYLWEIKKYTGFSIKSNRSGRAVVSYELVGTGSVPTPAAPTKTKQQKTPAAVKAPKVPNVVKTPAKTVPVVAQSEMNSDPIVRTSNRKIVDVLDEMDTDVISFEDRAFVEDFVRSL